MTRDIYFSFSRARSQTCAISVSLRKHNPPVFVCTCELPKNYGRIITINICGPPTNATRPRCEIKTEGSAAK